MTIQNIPLVEKDHIDKFYCNGYSISNALRLFDTDEDPIEIAADVLLVKRPGSYGSAIVTICRSKATDQVDTAQLRLNDMTGCSSVPVDLVDQNSAYVNPSRIPPSLTPLLVQTELAMMAVAYVNNVI